MTHFNNTQDIAAALRLLADDFAAAPNLVLPALAVRVDVQVSAWDDATQERRMFAVDLLTFAALGIDGERHSVGGSRWHYSTPFDHRERRGDGLRIAVYTEVSAPVEAVAA